MPATDHNVLFGTSMRIAHCADLSSDQDFTPVASPSLAKLASIRRGSSREGVSSSPTYSGDAKNGTGNGGIASVAWCSMNSKSRPCRRGGDDSTAKDTSSVKARRTSQDIMLRGLGREGERDPLAFPVNSDSFCSDTPLSSGTVESATKISITVMTPMSASKDLVVPQLAVCENLKQDGRQQLTTSLRGWYISCCCNERQVQWIAKMQRIGGRLHPLIVRYFQLWSFTGEAEFYVLFVPTTAWLGAPLSSMRIVSMLWMGQYVTGIMKDAFCCPRPPCPPLQLHGRRHTHENEYGFPSTHSCQSGVFSFLLYAELVRAFPDHSFLCWLVAVFYFANVSFSRMYLGMHWFGDLIGGAVVGLFTILSHVAFLDRWEAYILQRPDTPWWAYVLLYAIVHLLSMVHATPYHPCPCYIDSLRFTGAAMGSTIGLWKFHEAYGALAARPKPDRVLDVLFSFTFLMQWIVCMVTVFVSRELSALLAGVVLKSVFKFLSGESAARLPKPLQRAYLAMATVIGLTTLGNARGLRSSTPATAHNSPLMQICNVSHDSVKNGKLTATTAGGRSTLNLRSNPEAVEEEDDGYLNSQQVWSLRTHRHWWLWDVHRRTVSYAVMGFVVTFVCQVILREMFGVGRELAGSAEPHPGSLTPSAN
ncbi:hypothetical protein, conserved [Leishmania tarentolae]|uniref:Phosphatidic acid phosphatase type 2/haloperoxidase domain-containing protein n=1 Tax=Leishmania tarentolae TaxID=5689 RepID=A0A640KPN8_LEITA|nr:hypothetical protein, conserved [Leishmania tarentolae]